MTQDCLDTMQEFIETDYPHLPQEEIQGIFISTYIQ